MKLQLTPAAGLNLFTGYGSGYVAVNHVRHEKCLLVTPTDLTEWAVGGFETLSAGDFGFIAELRPEIVILGTGPTQRFPPPELARRLAATGIGIEIMDTRAACRTYNILAAEGRRVVAAILAL
jgi:uncharacterized protein